MVSLISILVEEKKCKKTKSYWARWVKDNKDNETHLKNSK